MLLIPFRFFHVSEVFFKLVHYLLEGKVNLVSHSPQGANPAAGDLLLCVACYKISL